MLVIQLDAGEVGRFLDADLVRRPRAHRLLTLLIRFRGELLQFLSDRVHHPGTDVSANHARSRAGNDIPGPQCLHLRQPC